MRETHFHINLFGYRTVVIEENVHWFDPNDQEGKDSFIQEMNKDLDDTGFVRDLAFDSDQNFTPNFIDAEVNSDGLEKAHNLLVFDSNLATAKIRFYRKCLF